MPRARIFLASLGLLALATGLAAACGHDHVDTPPGSPCTDPTRVSLPNTCESAGGDPFSDEACVNLDDRLSRAAPTPDDARAPAIAAPAEGEAVPAATPYTFRWTAPVAWRVTPRWERRPMTLADELHRWTALVPEAEAHCSPFNGRGYELVFKAGGTTVLRRQQSTTSWTPDAATWTRLADALAGRQAELTVVTTTFSNSQVGSAGIFVQTAPRRFTIAR